MTVSEKRFQELFKECQTEREKTGTIVIMLPINAVFERHGIRNTDLAFRLMDAMISKTPEALSSSPFLDNKPWYLSEANGMG